MIMKLGSQSVGARYIYIKCDGISIFLNTLISEFDKDGIVDRQAI
jgi:hypothetical protein